MNNLARLFVHSLAWFSVLIQSTATEKSADQIKVWRLDKLMEAESADAQAVEVSSIPRFLIVTENKVFDLLFIDKNGGHSSIHEKTVTAKTDRGSTQVLLIINPKNNEKFALQLHTSQKDDSILKTTLTPRGSSVFARVSRAEFHIASDDDSILKLKAMLTHDKILENADLIKLIESFLLHAKITGKQ